MESLTFFGVSVEYFGIFQVQRGKLRSFHFGVTLEFSLLENLSLIPWFCRICKTMLPICLCKTMLPINFN
jgi:hypothetical protein